MRYARALLACLSVAVTVGLSVRGAPAPAAPPPGPAPKLRALILSGSNNHDWKTTTPALRQALEASGRFEVAVNEAPPKLTGADLKDVDVIVSNFNAFTSRTAPPKALEWSEEAKQAYLEFVGGGKGLVTVHAGSASYYDWAEYQKAALGTFKLGQTGHGKYHEFPVTVGGPHPITAGLANFKTTDELWHRTAFREGATVLATAFSAKESGGSGQDEPVAAVGTYGKGRSFYLVLGHDAKAIANPGFRALLVRGTEWAATGRVTIEASTAAPAKAQAEEPAGEAVLVSAALQGAAPQPGGQPVDVAAVLQTMRAYKLGDSREPLQALERAVAAAGATAEGRKGAAEALAGFLSTDATADAREAALFQLKTVAGPAQVPAVAAALKDPALSMNARGVLEALPGEEAAAALRQAIAGADLGLVKGLVASLGARRDAGSVEWVAPLLNSPDAQVRQVSAWALGQIGTAGAARALLNAVDATNGNNGGADRRAVATALLRCARHAEGRDLPLAQGLYTRLTSPDMPEDLRAAALAYTLAAGKQAAVITEAMGSNDAVRQVAAIEALRRAADAKLSGEVAAGAGALPPELRARFLALLADQGGPGALAALAKYAADADPAVRQVCVRGLGKGDESAVAPLLKAIEAVPEKDKGAATELAGIQLSLSTLGGDKVDERLVAALGEGKPSVVVIRALADRGAAKAAPALAGLARGGDAKVAAEAIKALGEVGDLSVAGDLVGMLSSAHGEPARLALASLCKRNGRTAAPVLKAYEGAAPKVKQALLQVLPAVGGAEGLGLVRKELGSADAAVKTEAVRALAAWPDGSVAEDLLKVAEGPAGVERTLALRGLARVLPTAPVAPARKAEMVRAALKLEADAPTRGPVLAALADVPDLAALKLATEYLGDKDLAAAAGGAVLQLSYKLESNPVEVRAALRAVLGSKQAARTQALVRQRLAELGENVPEPRAAPAAPAKRTTKRGLSAAKRGEAKEGAAKDGFRWAETPTSVALAKGEQVVWRFNYDPKLGKPFVDPLAPVGGPSITRVNPPDHIWHYGLWFSWKYINGVNYWEEDKATFKAKGLTRWKDVKVETRADGSAKITLALEYAPAGAPAADAPPLLAEARSLEFSAPAADGSYRIDWTSAFKVGGADLVLDRTPLPGEKGGAAFGGYAGLSLRMQQLTNHKVVTTKGPVEFNPQNRFRGKDVAVDYAGELDGKLVGVAALDHPSNLNAPSPWYVIRDRAMNFYNAALLCFGPAKLKAGESFTLKYRLIVHNGAMEAKQLEEEAKGFAK